MDCKRCGRDLKQATQPPRWGHCIVCWDLLCERGEQPSRPAPDTQQETLV